MNSNSIRDIDSDEEDSYFYDDEFKNPKNNNLEIITGKTNRSKNICEIYSSKHGRNIERLREKKK